MDQDIILQEQDGSEVYRSEKLEKKKISLNTEKQVIKLASKIAEKLLVEIDRGNATGAFMIILMFAGFKDFLDFMYTLIETGVELTGAGAVVMAMIKPIEGLVMIFLSVILFILMRNMGFFLKTKVKIVFWILSFLGIIPILSFFPFETATALYAWHLVKKRAGKAEKKLKVVKKLTFRELDALERDISILDNED